VKIRLSVSCPETDPDKASRGKRRGGDVVLTVENGIAFLHHRDMPWDARERVYVDGVIGVEAEIIEG
jgi:hypothetical protein